jgi:hypothetical protein
MRRVVFSFACMAAAVALFACGGHSFIAPTPGGGNGGDGGSSQPPPNNLPVIDSITIQGSRTNEPANFADVEEAVDISAKVQDDETPPDQLEYEWTADVGTFSGSGASVTWQAPGDVEAPMDVTITLKVTEHYGQPGGPVFSHDATRTEQLSLHNSVKEVGGMSRQFLLDFSDSNLRDVSYIMRNFIKGCYGTQEETDQVSANRRDYRITDYLIGEPSVTLRFGGTCPYQGKSGDACAAVPVKWDSVFLKDNSRAPRVAGTDWIAAVYQPSEKKWGLCDSSFEGHLALSMRSFIR